MALPPSNKQRELLSYVPDDDNTSIYGLEHHLEAIMETVVAVYEQAGVPLPTRRYWMVGAPPEDCEQVVVSLLQIYLGQPGDQAADIQRCDAPVTAVVNVHVTRDYPIGELGKAVNADRIIEASRWSVADSWVLFKAMKEFDKDEWGVPGLGAIATVTGRPPGGGVQSTVLNLSTAVLT